MSFRLLLILLIMIHHAIIAARCSLGVLDCFSVALPLAVQSDVHNRRASWLHWNTLFATICVSSSFWIICIFVGFSAVVSSSSFPREQSKFLCALERNSAWRWRWRRREWRCLGRARLHSSTACTALVTLVLVLSSSCTFHAMIGNPVFRSCCGTGSWTNDRRRHADGTSLLIFESASVAGPCWLSVVVIVMDRLPMAVYFVMYNLIVVFSFACSFEFWQ